MTTTLGNFNYLVLFSVHLYEGDDTPSDFSIYPWEKHSTVDRRKPSNIFMEINNIRRSIYGESSLNIKCYRSFLLPCAAYWLWYHYSSQFLFRFAYNNVFPFHKPLFPFPNLFIQYHHVNGFFSSSISLAFKVDDCCVSKEL